MSQRTEQWHGDRCGSATGSRFKDIPPGKSGKYLKAREDYMFDIIAERLTGEPIIKNIGANGQWGEDIEYYARIAYEAKTGLIVKEVDFIPHPSIEFVGVSPDGYVGDDGGVEIKSRVSTSDHLKTIVTKIVPEEHIPQIQGNMWVTGRQWWDFVSYNPHFPENMRLYIHRVERDEEYIKKLESEIVKFLGEVQTFMQQIPEAA